MFTIVASITTSSCASPTLPRIHQRRAGRADSVFPVRDYRGLISTIASLPVSVTQIDLFAPAAMPSGVTARCG